MVMRPDLGPLIALLKPNARPNLDYKVVDRLDGLGPQIAVWDAVALGPIPTPAQLDAAQTTFDSRADKRDGEAQLQKIAMEFLVAFLINRKFAGLPGAGERLAAVDAKIDAWKAAHPGVVP